MKRKALTACQNVEEAVGNGNRAPKRRLLDDAHEAAPQQQRSQSKTGRGVDAAQNSGEENLLFQQPSRLAQLQTSLSAHVPVSLNLTTESHNQAIISSVCRIAFEHVSSGSENEVAGRHNSNGAHAVSDAESDFVAHWAQHGYWPPGYFTDDRAMDPLNDPSRCMPPPPRKISRKGESASSAGSSEQLSISKSTVEYANINYEALMATKGCFMRDSDLGITEASQALCHQLVTQPQLTPAGTLFSDDLFDDICNNLEGRNEAKIVQDISRLIVPSVEELAFRGAKELKFLIETVNEGWDRSIPVTKSRPQPDYAVGFRRWSFSDERLSKLGPYIGEITDLSYIMASVNMVLPFLTCETKSDSAGLLVAHKQNLHSMMLTVRGVIALFKAVGREKELHREILAFSISHNATVVHIYGHYAEVMGRKTKYYRHLILRFPLTGNDKWTAYRFVKNIYDVWVPIHFQRLCSVIDALHDPDSGYQGPDNLITGQAASQTTTATLAPTPQTATATHAATPQKATTVQAFTPKNDTATQASTPKKLTALQTSSPRNTTATQAPTPPKTTVTQASTPQKATATRASTYQKATQASTAKKVTVLQASTPPKTRATQATATQISTLSPQKATAAQPAIPQEATATQASTTEKATVTQARAGHTQSISSSSADIRRSSPSADTTSNPPSKKSGTVQKSQDVLRRTNPRRKARKDLEERAYRE